MTGLIVSSTLKAVRNESPAPFRRLPQVYRVAIGERSFSTSTDGSNKSGASRADFKEFPAPEGGGEKASSDRLTGSQVTYEEAFEAAIPKYNKEAIPAHMMDIMLTDITEEGLKKAASSLGVKNLARAAYPARSFPVKGLVYGLNLRLMVNLVCGYEDRRPISIVFLVDTGSAPSFITPDSIDALRGSRGGNISKQLNVRVQSPGLPVPMDTTPQGEHSHFPYANVLGMSALAKLNLSIVVDYKMNAFHLVPNAGGGADYSNQFQSEDGGVERAGGVPSERGPFNRGAFYVVLVTGSIWAAALLYLAKGRRDEPEGSQSS